VMVFPVNVLMKICIPPRREMMTIWIVLPYGGFVSFPLYLTSKEDTNFRYTVLRRSLVVL
jgi:hypothetical protein